MRRILDSISFVLLLAMLVTVALYVTLMVRVKKPKAIAPEKAVTPENEVTPSRQFPFLCSLLTVLCCYGFCWGRPCKLQRQMAPQVVRMV